jgi:hypothetical protein
VQWSTFIISIRFKRRVACKYACNNGEGTVDERIGMHMRTAFVGASNIMTKFKSISAVETVIVPFLNKCRLINEIYHITTACINRLKTINQDLRSQFKLNKYRVDYMN